MGFINILFSILIINAAGVSPDFARRTIEDKPDSNIKDIDINPGLKKIIRNGTVLLDIVSSTYVSDGRYLNGTIWMLDPLYIKDHALYVKNNLTFVVFVYTNEEIAPTYSLTPTYSLIISPQQDGTWQKIFIEMEPDVLSERVTSQKVIDVTNNYTGLFEDGNRYVDFSIDLEKISYPDIYWLDFQTSTTDFTSGIKFKDNTFIYRAPPLESKLSYDWEKPLRIRPGSEQTFKLFINSTDQPVKQTLLFSDSNSSDKIHVSFNPNNVAIEPTGKNFTNMKIIVDKEAQAETQSKIDKIISVSVKTEENTEWRNRDSLVLSIELLPSLSIGDFLIDAKLIYVIPIAVTTLIVLWVSRKIDRVKKYSSLNADDLLNADATIIAGVLIFLTIGSVEFSQIINKIGILTASIVLPFALAAVRMLIKGEAESLGIKFMAAGFVYMMTSVIVIGFVNL
jgi:hypothetical protein